MCKRNVYGFMLRLIEMCRNELLRILMNFEKFVKFVNFYEF